MSLLHEYIAVLIENENERPKKLPFNIPIPKDLEDIHKRIKYAGRELFLVGGAVRDALMGKNPKDYDVATNASPEEVIKILQRDSSLRLDLTGKQFGVVRVKTEDGGEYEIATFREDIGKGKGTSVKFSTIENDVKRRDLTINALFYDMDSGEVVDYVGGIKDIEDGIIRAVGDPAKRFDEDKIRILRAIRFAGRMGSDLDPATKKAIIEDNQLVDTNTGQPIPADRITEEFIKGLKSSADVNRFLSLIDELNMFDQILPGLEIEIQASGTQDYIAQLAAILKNNSPDLVVPVLKRMRYSNDESKTIKFLLELSSLNKDTAAGLKKSFNRLNIRPEHLHNFAEITGSPSESVVRGFLEFAAAPPAGNPKDLMDQGLKGPEIGQALADAEREAYSEFIGEIKKYIRQVMSESLDDFNIMQNKILISPPPQIVDRVKELPVIESQGKNPVNPDELQDYLDSEMVLLFDLIIQNAGYESYKKNVKRYKKEIKPIIKFHKNYFNALRPHELAELVGASFNYDHLESAQTPSYPSGHTTQAYYIAYKLSETFPNLKSSFFKLAEMIAESRIDRGVHFLSDNEAGKLLAAKLAGKI